MVSFGFVEGGGFGCGILMGNGVDGLDFVVAGDLGGGPMEGDGVDGFLLVVCSGPGCGLLMVDGVAGSLVGVGPGICDGCGDLLSLGSNSSRGWLDMDVVLQNEIHPKRSWLFSRSRCISFIST